MEGKLLPVTHIKDHHYFVPDGSAPDGCKYGPIGVHFPDGELLYTREEYDEIKQELLQKREEVAELMAYKKLLDETTLAQAMESLESANRAIRRLQNMYDKVKEEKMVLVQQIEQEVDRQVQLPQKVTQALKSAQTAFNIPVIVEAIWDRSDGYGLADVHAWVYYSDQSHSGVIERKKKILGALINGYTVEPAQSPEEKAARYLNDNRLIEKGVSAQTIVTAVKAILDKAQK